MEKKNNKKIIIALIAVVLVIVCMLLVYNINKPKATQGAKHVTIEVVDNNGASKAYETNTDAEFLSQVFDEIEDLAVEGETSEYGLYITTVNGLTADFDTDGAYWSIYVNGEYGSYGADSQPVTDGDAYKLAYEVYQ